MGKDSGGGACETSLLCIFKDACRWEELVFQFFQKINQAHEMNEVTSEYSVMKVYAIEKKKTSTLLLFYRKLFEYSLGDGVCYKK